MNQIVFANGVWKSGNNLLIKILGLMGKNYKNFGLAASSVNGDNHILRVLARKSIYDRYPINVGLELSAEVSERWLKRKIHTCSGGVFSGHAAYSLRLKELLDASSVDVIQIIRDPRDVALSYCHWIVTRPDYYPYPLFSKGSFNDRFRLLIEGVSEGRVSLDSFRSVLDRSIGWVEDPSVLVVRFENLVDKQSRYSEYEKVARLVGFDGDIENVIASSFGGTHTFRKGESGQWRSEFTDEMHDLFNKTIGGRMAEWGY